MEDWDGKCVLIIGAGRQGIALSRYLSQKGAKVLLNDRLSKEELGDAVRRLSDLNIATVFGSHPISLLNGMDWVCVSGGVPINSELVQAAMQKGMKVSNDSEIFLQDVDCKVVGITGSAGKTTTTSLVGNMARVWSAAHSHTQVGYPVSDHTQKVDTPEHIWVGGNIGNPLISDLDSMHPNDLAIMELSSFQLEIMNIAPDIAVLLNISPNHLDRHGCMDHYIAAKSRILQYQKPHTVAILNTGDEVVWGLRHRVVGKIIGFGLLPPKEVIPCVFMKDGWLVYSNGKSTYPIMDQANIMLRGEHNLLNVLAACAISVSLGMPIQAMREGVGQFMGVPHRLELVRSWGGAEWYNDSIATTPERAMAAIRSFNPPIVLIAGGRDKKLPWEDFAELVCERVDHLILFGELSSLIADVIGAKNRKRTPQTTDNVNSLADAITIASRIVQQGDVVLFSPGGTSFDAFKNFEHRGEMYRKLVEEIQ